MEWLHDLLLYGEAVINNWAGYATGGILVALMWLRSVWRPEWKLSRRLGLSLASAFLFFASFQAWRDQYQRGARLQAQIEKTATREPTFQVNVAPVPAPTVIVSAPVDRSGQPESPSLFLSCDAVGLPIREPSGSYINLLQVPSIVGIARVASNSQDYWPTPNRNPGTIDRCDLINYSNGPVFSLLLDLTVATLETKRGNHIQSCDGCPIVSSSSGGVIASGQPIKFQRQGIRADKIDSGKAYRFYVYNFSRDFVRVQPADHVSLETKDSAKTLRAKLKLSSTATLLVPPREDASKF